MADRSDKTRRKLTFTIASLKPRNPLVAPAMKRAAGAHRKSSSATRSAERLTLLRAIDDKDRSDD